MGKVGLVVLAAGASRRLGKPKQLLMFQQKTMLQHVLDQTGAFPFAVKVLVLGAYAKQILEPLNIADFRVKIHEHWRNGIASSLCAGVEQALADCPDLEHLLFLLSDQPFVSSELIESLVNSQLEHGKPITACRYQGQLGVPAIFEKKLFPELLQLRGDRGANRLIQQYGDRVGEFPFEMGGVDVDTAEDYRNVKSRVKHTYASTVYDFAKDILVECPNCAGKALVRVDDPNPRLFEIRGVKCICATCGYNKTLENISKRHDPKQKRGKILIYGTQIDPYFHLPLWLQVEFSGETLWAYNREHLDFLAEHVGAKLRERRGANLSRSIGSRLPRWMTSAGNREAVLQVMEKLKGK